MCALTLIGSFGAGVAAAHAASTTKIVRYGGERLVVPADWPVFRLASDPTVCVRFNRHAVYLGRVGSEQRCPARAVGRTEAILVEPLSATVASAGGRVGGSAGVGMGSELPAGDGTSLRLRAADVLVTATWDRHPALIKRALRVRRLGVGSAIAARAPASFTPRASAASGVYTGLGFDVCAAPSVSQMTAWGASPYHAIGVYIGGTNRGCSQPNLTATWISQESLAGWSLIPTYVGLQAPGACGCKSFTPGNASAQGTAAAIDAVAQAQALGIGPGNPIYDDMEAYATGGTNSPAVLAFLAAWTTQLHASGYLSGVYSSAASGISDLAAAYGTGYVEPDDIWIADWNGVQGTNDPYVPAADWASHQRLHQFSGGHNVTYGGVTLNIDGDYLDGATAGAGNGPPVIPPAPSLSVSTAADGGIELFPSWTGASGVSAWQVIAGQDPTALSPAANPISTSTKPPIVVHSAFPYFAVEALGATGQLLGSSAPVPTPAHLAIFGRNVFISSRGTGGLPVGCFNAAPCHVSTTVSVGRTVIARTGSEHVGVGGGLAFFTLTKPGATMLAHAPGRRLAVKVSVRDASGLRVTSQLTLIPFTTSGRGPVRSRSLAPQLAVIGTTDFVAHGWVGGILAACFDVAPCHPVVTLSAGGRTIAHSGSQFLGVGQLGYEFFSLTSDGHQMLMHARGNQLAANLTISAGAATVTARIVLVSFS